MAHSVIGIDLDDMQETFQQMYDSVIETVWQSVYSDLTIEELEEIKDDINMELMKVRTVLEEAISSNKIGDKV
tara:strand:- start:1905 stop:2123 length:219 start_codon:yes stop_codon:yes gene_type:complete